MDKFWKQLAGIALLLMLAGCGFHLQPPQNYPFKRLYINAPLDMRARMSRAIEGRSDTQVVDQMSNADAVLTVSEATNQRVLTLNLKGVAQEYELASSITYQLTTAQGHMLIAPSTIRMNRAMTYSDQFFLAKENESVLLYADMRRAAADQIIRRLSGVHDLNTTLPGINPTVPLPTPPL
jgi:LPS-assembly lipoprotein